MTGSLVGIPNNVENPELTSFMVEMMTRKSLDTLRVAYYDVVAKNQSMRDEDSVKMLDIIIGSRVFDPYFINTWVDNTWYYFFAWHVAEMPNNVQFSSQYDKQKDATEKAIQNTIDTYMSYIEG
ncbi:hypothetical protein SDC9_188070 [bioreactor metagenome]|uniref:Uncharacterized protein n=1 Tax=bioreactor metagenome TaxID=1076179 RepID=A0A645HPZ8_9ZZZZ